MGSSILNRCGQSAADDLPYRRAQMSLRFYKYSNLCFHVEISSWHFWENLYVSANAESQEKLVEKLGMRELEFNNLHRNVPCLKEFTCVS